MDKKWYVSSMGTDPHNQGVVADENTGETVAISYKTENAPILAAAPEAIGLLAEVLDTLNNMTSVDFSLGKDRPIRDRIARFLDELSYVHL